jgi:hypothetical protein
MDPNLRMSIIRRVLLYVSPLAWGSPAAEAYGSRDSLERIVCNLWDSSLPPEQRRAFSSGAKVLWSPIVVDRRKTRYLLRSGPLASDVLEQPMWLAHRAPPSSREANQILTNISVNRLENSDSSMMWDGRFYFKVDLTILRQHLSLQSTDILSITPTSRWFLPSVYLATQTRKVLLGEFKVIKGTDRSLHPGNYIWTAEYPGSINCHSSRYMFTGAR